MKAIGHIQLVDVEVDVAVDVVVDGDGDLDVGVQTLTPSEHLRQHGNDPFQQRDSSLVPWRRQELPQPQNVERRGTFHRLTSRDLVVLRAICVRPTARTLGDVPHDGFCCSEQLIRSLRMSARKVLDALGGQGKELDSALIHIEALKTEHADFIGE